MRANWSKTPSASSTLTCNAAVIAWRVACSSLDMSVALDSVGSNHCSPAVARPRAANIDDAGGIDMGTVRITDAGVSVEL